MKTPDGKPIAAFVLAGRRPGAGAYDPLAGFENAPHKALIEFEARPMIAHVLAALAEAGFAEATTVIADADVLALLETTDKAGMASDTLLAGETLGDTMAHALAAAGDERSLLVTTVDHALLSAYIVKQFLSRINPQTDLAAAVVPEDVYRRAYPEGPRTFLRFSDMAVSGANLFWISGARARPLIEFWRRVESKRKNPLAMAREIGIVTALAYAAGLLSSKAAVARLSRITGVKAQLIALDIPEAAIDVDKPEDVALVRAILNERPR